MLKPFDVWLQPLAARTCRIRVDGLENANWLLARLCTAYVIKTREPIKQEQGSTFYTFDVLYPQQYSHNMLAELVERFPPIRLQTGSGMCPTPVESTLASEEADV